jgi:hypothetical protein
LASKTITEPDGGRHKMSETKEKEIGVMPFHGFEWRKIYANLGSSRIKA